MATHLHHVPLVRLVLALAGFTILIILAMPVPAASLQTPGDGQTAPGSAELTGIDVPVAALPILQRLGIRYLDAPKDGMLSAAATHEQMAVLSKEGIAFTEVGKVVIFEGGGDQPTGAGPASPDMCFTPNYVETSITCDQQPTLSSATTNCAEASGQAITSVRVHYYVVHPNTNYWLELSVRSNSPSQKTVLLEPWYGWCGGSPPLLTSKLEDWHTTKEVADFNGRPVNQTWQLVAFDHCCFQSAGYIDHWIIYVYYSPSTPTPTRTATRTVSRTATRTATGTATRTWTRTATRTATSAVSPTWTGTATATRTPTATGTAVPAPGITVDKRLLDGTHIVVSDTVTFEISIYNSGDAPIRELYLKDTYPTEFLTYLGATPAADDNIDDGVIEWKDLIPSVGVISPGQTVTVTVLFHARTPTEGKDVENCAYASLLFGQIIISDEDCERIDIYARVPAIEVSKYLLSPPLACVSDTVTYAIVFTNTGDAPLTAINITDTYDVNQLGFGDPTRLGPDDGQLNINLFPVGPSYLPPQASGTFTLSFHADAAADPAVNSITATARSYTVVAPSVSDSADLVIEAPGPCEGNAVVNGDFESAMANPPWITGGTTSPSRVSDYVHGGSYSLRLGPPGIDRVALSNSFAEQWVDIPNNAAQAELRFWYRMDTNEITSKFDRFTYYARGATSISSASALADTDWVLVTMSLDAFRGQSVRVGFELYQDRILPTTVWLDDVQICFAVCGEPGGNNPPPGGLFCWKQDGLPDYAPAGVPDFDMRQATWVYTPTETWLYDAPLAVADSLWWFDSKFESAAVPPPTVTDRYALVTAYGQWDDHDARNVQPLVTDLAARMGPTSATTGTIPSGVAAGVRSYLDSKQLAISYTVTLKDEPTYDWVRDEVKRSEDVVLLLGFWELQGDGWRRLGGHYVTAAGVSCYGEGIAISDPWRDNAENGGPGEVSLIPPPHAHPAAPPESVHNDAAYVAHDAYDILDTDTPGGDWGLAGYAKSYAEIANFAGANVPGALAEYQAERYRNGEIVAVVEQAIAVSPVPAAVTLRVDPNMSHAYVGDIISVDLLIDGAGQAADTVGVYLDFNPSMLAIVDASGNPISHVIAGPDFPAPFVNEAYNSVGHIDYLTFIGGSSTLRGGMTLATLRFKALAATPSYGTPLAFSFTGERITDIMGAGTSLLGPTQVGFVSVAASQTLTGTVALQGRGSAPSASWVVPLAFTMHEPGRSASFATYAITTSTSGQFTLTNVPTGTFDLKIKAVHTLRNKATGVHVGEAQTVVGLGTLLEGDANNDNKVTAADLSIYAASQGKSAGQAGFDPRADFNGDETVDSNDFALLSANFGKSGDVVIGGTTAGPGQPESTRSFQYSVTGVAPGGTVDIALLPAEITATVDQVFTVTAQAQAGSQPLDAVELHIDFPTSLMVVALDGTPVEIIEGDPVLPIQAQNRVDNSMGQIDYAAAYVGSTPPTGTFTLATIRFLAGALTPSDYVRFVLQPGRETDVMYQEQSVLGQADAAHVVVLGASPVTPTPTPTGVASATPTPTVMVTATRTATRVPTATTTATATPQEGVAITLSPAAVSVTKNEIFTLDVMIAAGDVTADGVDAFVSFDPARLHVVNAAGEDTTSIEADSSRFEVSLLNSADNTLGRISFSSGSFTGAGGNFRIAIIRFKARTAGAATVGFDREPPRKTDVGAGGVSVLETATGATVTIRPEAVIKLYLPVILSTF